MTTVRDEISIDVPAAFAWTKLKDVSRTHELFPGVLVGSSLEGDIRTVTFANGSAVQERIISIADELRRIAYTVLGGRFEHHASSMQIEAIDADHCRFVWTSDFLPDSRAETVRPLMSLGCAALKRALEHDNADHSLTS